MGKNAPRRAGFTLVEFLAVVAIIVTLAALLLPGLSRAREKSRAAACLNNLRQVGQAAMLYHDDFAGLPPAQNSGYFLWNGSQYVLYGQLLPVTGRALARSFYCPAAREFSAHDPLTGLQNLGVPGQVAVGSYYARGLQHGAPQRLDDSLAVALVADLFFASGSARNHPAGVNVLMSDISARYVRLPAAWNIGASGAWDDLDNR